MIRRPESGNLRFHAIRDRSGEVQQLAVQNGINCRSVLGCDRLQRAEDVFREPEGDAAEREQGRQDGGGIGPERVYHLGKSPLLEGDQSDLSPREAPPSLAPVILASVERRLPFQFARRDSEESRTFGEPIRLYRAEKKSLNALLSTRVVSHFQTPPFRFNVAVAN